MEIEIFRKRDALWCDVSIIRELTFILINFQYNMNFAAIQITKMYSLYLKDRCMQFSYVCQKQFANARVKVLTFVWSKNYGYKLDVQPHT